MRVSTIAPHQIVDCMKGKISNIHRYRRPNGEKKKRDRRGIYNTILMNRPNQRKKKSGEKKHGVGFETVAGVGGAIIVETLRCVADFYLFYFSPNERCGGVGGGGRYVATLFLLFSFPRSADHERARLATV